MAFLLVGRRLFWWTPLVVVLSGPAPTRQPGTVSQPLPDPAVFAQKVRDTARLDYELQTNFTYLEQRRDLRISPLGKITVGPLRTFEVYPSNVSGRTYKRLIAIDGKPLTAAELARRDDTHRRDLANADTPEEQAKRAREDEQARREREAIVEDTFAVFAPTLVDRQLLDGHSVIKVTLTPRADARVHTREGRWLKHFAGEAWVAEADHQVVRVDVHAIDDVTIGWGIVGRIYEGSRFVFSRRKIEDTWLPAEVRFEASGRTLLFRKFQLNLITTYSDYRRRD